MKCVICKTGEMRPGHVTVTLERAGTVVVIKEVPADVCSDCGEYSLDEAVAARVYAQADAAGQRHAEVEVLSVRGVKAVSVCGRAEIPKVLS